MTYTIVVPCFNEQDNIIPLYERVKSVLRNQAEFTILFVNDGSTDATLEQLRTLHARDPRCVKYISLLANSGQQKALFAGLCSCRTSFAVTMDADLQHPPEFIPEMIALQQSTAAHIVTGKRKGHQQGFMKDFLSKFFYQFFYRLTGISIEAGISDFRLYSRKALDIMCTLKEREPFLRGMVSKLGFKSVVIEYQLQERHKGVPAYTFAASLRMGLRALLRFSKTPVKIGLYIGMAGIIISVAQALHYLYLRLFTDQLVPGQADLMVFLGLLGSVMLLQISLLLRVAMHMMDSLQAHPIFIVEEAGLDDEQC